MDNLQEFLNPLLDVWETHFGGPLTLTSEQSSLTLSFPIIPQDKTIAWLTGLPERHADSARPVLESWAGIISSWMEERDIATALTDELIIAWSRLTYLHKVITMMGTVVDPKQRAVEALRKAKETIRTQNAFYVRWKEEAPELTWLDAEAPRANTQAVIKALMASRERVQFNTAEQCQENLPGSPGVVAFMGQALYLSGDARGVIGFVNPLADKFSAGDVQLFESLIEQVMTFAEIEEYNRRAREGEKVNHELELAGQVQASFLPPSLPNLPGYQFACAYQPASKLGGDFYDIVDDAAGNRAVTICDVVGKGIPAALLAAETRAIIRSEVADYSDAGKVLSSANSKLYADLDRNDRFVTASLVRIPIAGGPLTYASAGHTRLLWLHADTLAIQTLPSLTVPLGVYPEIEARRETIDLALDDVLVMYSDGLTDSLDTHGSPLGLAGVKAMVLASHLMGAQGIMDSLLHAGLKSHAGPPVDDLTVVVIKRADSVDEPVPVTHLHVTGEASLIPEIEQALEPILFRLREGSPASTWLLETQLALIELITNVFHHAYQNEPGVVDAALALYPDRLEVNMIDSGAPYEQPELSPATPIDIANLPDGGYGMPIIHQAMNTVRYARLADGYNHWQLCKTIPTAQGIDS